MNLKSILMQRDFRVTKATIKSLKNPNIELGHRWNNSFSVNLKDGEKYISTTTKYTFPSALEIIRELLLLGVPSKISVHGSDIYTELDILTFLSTTKYDGKQDEGT